MYGILNPKNKSPSLKLLADLFLSQKISKDFQRSDWRIRPLFKEMITYAGTDALLLPFIYFKQLMEANVEKDNEKDKEFWESIKKHFGSKRQIKCKGRKNYLRLMECE
jgi:ribonuclease D